MMTGLSSLENQPYPPPQKPEGGIILKCLIIGGLVMASLLPLSMINGLIHERQQLNDSVTNEIRQNWGSEQTVVGPILNIPYKVGNEQKTFVLFPQALKTHVTMKPSTLHRGIFKAVGYTGDTQLEGNYDLSTLPKEVTPENIQWKNSTIEFALSHPDNIERQANLEWQGKNLQLTNTASNILSSPLSVNKANKIPFSLHILIRGSKSLMVAPIGLQNTIHIDSEWKDPNFTGHSPSISKINDKGFTATWDMGPMGIHPRSGYLIYPSEVHNPAQSILGESVGSQIGVELLQQVDGYRQTYRAIKYGVLFVVLTFATYFLFELIAKQPLHPFQYLLIAFAICLFYLLLLALSELIQFGFAYTVASCGIIATISLYSKAILGKTKKHAESLIGGLLGVLYGYLYILLQLEDLSLLFGSLGLLAILGAIMYVTRNIDWYGDTSSVQAH